jgi:hypothetical protein
MANKIKNLSKSSKVSLQLPGLVLVRYVVLRIVNEILEVCDEMVLGSRGFPSSLL